MFYYVEKYEWSHARCMRDIHVAPNLVISLLLFVASRICVCTFQFIRVNGKTDPVEVSSFVMDLSF